MKRTLVGLAFLLALLPVAGGANADPRTAAVLDAEQRWLDAFRKHDVKTLASILSPDFVHINYRGALFNRDAALMAAKSSSPYVQKLSEETVDFVGNTAIVHGLNSILQNGRIVFRLRFTDVFEFRDGKWIAHSAQETPVQ